MDKQDLKYIKRDTREIKVKNIEEFWLMFLNFINNYIPAVIKMGVNHQLTVDSLKAFKEFYFILKKEAYILTIIEQNGKDMDFELALDLLNDLDF